MSPETPPRLVVFDPTPEIFATDSQGGFSYPLHLAGKSYLTTAPYEEMRFVVSVWHPASQRSIELDRAYVELRAALDPEEEHWTRLAEIEPVVPPYGAESFDGWIVLPVVATSSAFMLAGNGFEPRTRLQARASVYLVA